jgi:hypothetical protein
MIDQYIQQILEITPGGLPEQLAVAAFPFLCHSFFPIVLVPVLVLLQLSALQFSRCNSVAGLGRKVFLRRCWGFGFTECNRGSAARSCGVSGGVTCNVGEGATSFQVVFLWRHFRRTAANLVREVQVLKSVFLRSFQVVFLRRR